MDICPKEKIMEYSLDNLGWKHNGVKSKENNFIPRSLDIAMLKFSQWSWHI